MTSEAIALRRARRLRRKIQKRKVTANASSANAETTVTAMIMVDERDFEDGPVFEAGGCIDVVDVTLSVLETTGSDSEGAEELSESCSCVIVWVLGERSARARL